MKAFIFAAGLGTRLKPLTDTMPKALVPIGGVPMLKILLNKLISNGYDDIVINVHHFAEQIENYIFENNSFSVKITFSNERDLLRDTGGGIKHAKTLLLEGNGEPILVHNVDILSNLDLNWFRSIFLSSRAEANNPLIATILVSERDTSRYFLFDDSNRLVGWTNIATGEVKSPYPDLDVAKCRKLAFAGVHTISPEIFPLMDSFPETFSIVDFYLSICDKYSIVGVLQDGLEIHDIGKLSDLYKFNTFAQI